MNITSKIALNLLDKAAGDRKGRAKWYDHCICVGRTAKSIAKAIGLDEDKACALGYVHDIGKAFGGPEDHAINGYNFLVSQGIDKEDAGVCITHSYLNNDVACIAEPLQPDFPFRTEYVRTHEYTIYEKLICLCDLMCTDVTMTLEKRLIDIISRKGVHENTVYHIKEAQKLKEFFDSLMRIYGYANVYSVLLNIKWK